ncbi:MAG TPA: glutamine--fructose-6-phosphate transaminase (isomerizing) [Methylomirabilota bacterium]|nr:glutamine--fructose-6-phosphate transaminase (isomerizing) [Methylomirabilota bacterium]
MCGIAGVALKNGEVGPIIYECLKRLEYRGYDSVGEAAVIDGRIVVKKDKGKIDEVERELAISSLAAAVGIGHTRWATHGAPSAENAHPHTDCLNSVAVVHNGIIENFMDLRQELEHEGHTFKSRTDTEVVAHLVERYLKSGDDLAEAVRKTAKKLKGAYALAIISTCSAKEIVCVRNESPLVLGTSEVGNYCASDIPAFLPRTNRVILLEDNEMGIITSDKIIIRRISDGSTIHRESVTVDWSIEQAVKTGYTHFMIKEIHEQPISVRNALRTHPIYLDLMALAINRARRIFLIACGTSYHACLASSYTFANLAKVSVIPVIASEFIDNYGTLIDKDTVVLAVSQSGETADTLSAVRGARDRGATILGISNSVSSTLTRLSDVYIGQNSGPEIGVAATKTFTAQVAILTKIAVALANKRQVLRPAELEMLESAFANLPGWLSRVILQEDQVMRIAERYGEKASFCYLGRGINVATALEGRLKLLELSYVPAIAYPAGESKHGFISVVENGYPVIFIAPKDETHSKIIGNVMEMKARGARIISIIEEDDDEIQSLSDEVVKVPAGIPPILSPIIYVVPLQFLAYQISLKRGHDPDFPRNLAKSVTVH